MEKEYDKQEKETLKEQLAVEPQTDSNAQAAQPAAGNAEEFPVRLRLATYVLKKGLTQYAFAASIGATPNYVSCVRNTIAPEKLAAIITKFPDLNIPWLLTGIGNMYNEGFETADDNGANTPNPRRRGRKASTLEEANEARKDILYNGITADKYLNSLWMQLQEEEHDSDNPIKTLRIQREELLALLKLQNPLLVKELNRLEDRHVKEEERLQDQLTMGFKNMNVAISNHNEEVKEQIRNIHQDIEQKYQEREQKLQDKIQSLEAALAKKEEQQADYMHTLMNVALGRKPTDGE